MPPLTYTLRIAAYRSKSRRYGPAAAAAATFSWRRGRGWKRWTKSASK
jgi:hypothetical protein